MRDWPDRVCDDPVIYRVSMPFSNLKDGQSNCYFVCVRGEWLIVDAGAYSLANRELFLRAAFSIGVDLSRCAMVLTHMHFDHAEMARYVLPAHARIYAAQSGVAARMPSSQKALRRSFVRLMVSMGVSPQDAFSYAICDAEIAYLNPDLFDVRFVASNDEISVGGMSFKVIATPGHAFDHLCLFQEERKILFSGDAVCPGLTPSIDIARFGEDTYRVFWESLDRIGGLAPMITLPGHGDVMAGPVNARIEEIKEKKRLKLERTFDSVSVCGFGTGEDVARRFARMDRDDWNGRGMMPRYYTMLEVTVMLRHLEELGRIEREFDAYCGSYRYCVSIR